MAWPEWILTAGYVWGMQCMRLPLHIMEPKIPDGTKWSSAPSRQEWILSTWKFLMRLVSGRALWIDLVQLLTSWTAPFYYVTSLTRTHPCNQLHMWNIWMQRTLLGASLFAICSDKWRWPGPRVYSIICRWGVSPLIESSYVILL